ncbi:hypothetical protein SpCBS45565_g01964 [Spizellomyces sp. 'palustris']|nr:hypothetical protein SpCBS45565_g01964 [Spizellomyces sp. 'palustris']
MAVARSAATRMSDDMRLGGSPVRRSSFVLVGEAQDPIQELVAESTKPVCTPPPVDTIQLLIDLNDALLAYGTPSHRMEALVDALGESLHVPVKVYYLPTYTLLHFLGPLPPGKREQHIVKTRGGWDFGKLQVLHALCKDLIRGRTNPAGAKKKLHDIRNMRDAWSELWIVAGYPVSAATSAIMFFNGNGWDALASGLLACIPGGMRLIANRFPSLWWTYEIICCALISTIAASISSTRCYPSLLLSSVVTLLPGYTVTASVVEILTKNVISGSVRLCYTVVYLAAMAYGLTLAPLFYNVAVGNGFQRRPPGVENACTAEQTIAVSHLWLILCVPLYIVSYNVYLKSPPRQWPVMTLIGALGYGISYLSKRIWHAPPEINAFTSALGIGLASNMYARVTDDLSFHAITAGVFIQVPGSWGLRGMLALAYQEYDRSLYWNYSMLVICVGIGGAILMSNYMVWGFRLKNRRVPLTDF